MEIRSEHVEQREFVSWFRKTYDDVLIFAVPNGGLRNPREALRLKVEGVVSGIPDLHIPAWSLWVEMKRTKAGRLSPEQKKVIEYLESIGHTVIVGRGAKDASEQVNDFAKKRDA